MNITSLLRVRNGELLIFDTLKHLSEFSDEICVIDDASTDKTPDICQEHPKVKKVLRNYFHNPNQALVQTAQRALLLNYARADSKNQWFLSTDIDDRFILDWDKLEKYDKDGYSAIGFKCFDAYLTKGNSDSYRRDDKLIQSRKYFGPEYREIFLLFKGSKTSYNWQMAGQRQPDINGKTIMGGLLWHYGKALSIKQWEEKCRYYMASMPQLSEKWKERRGKAIHTKSDFGRELLTKEQILSGKYELVKI